MGRSRLACVCLGTILVGGSLADPRSMKGEFIARPVGCHVAEWNPRNRARKRSGSTRCRWEKSWVRLSSLWTWWKATS